MGFDTEEWMYEVWESYKFYVQKLKEDSRRPRCYTLSRERRCVASGVLQVRKRGRVSPRKLPSLGGFV